MSAPVLVTRHLPAGADEELDSTWQVWEGDGPMPHDRLLEGIREVEGLVCTLVDRIDAEVLAAAPHLRVISQMAVGVDNIDVAGATDAGIPVGHTPDVLTETTADTAFALLAVATRRLIEGRDILARGEVGDWDPGFLLGGDLWDTTLGIVGLGRIGAAIARRATGFGMRVLYTSRTPKEDDHRAEWRPLSDLLTASDHVVLAAPLTPETRHLIGASALRSMKDGATLVNIARGGLVDHAALTVEASTGRIRVALDVTEPEPLPPGHPLLDMPNVVVVPHLGSASVRTRRAMARLALANLRAGLTGQRLSACVNPAVYE